MTEKKQLTFGLNTDLLAIVREVKDALPKFEEVPLATFVRRLIVEGANRMHGDDNDIDYVKRWRDKKY